MLFEALDVIAGLLNEFIAPGSTDKPLVLSNISRLNDGDEFAATMNDKLIMSIVNIEEDRISKSPENFIKENSVIRYKNPAIHLNFTILFSATHTNYEQALLILEKVIRFFQIKFVFTPADTPELQEINDTGNGNVEKIIFDMMNLNLEQVNQLWTTLGGHYMPSLVYRLRMITIDERVIQKEGLPIKKIEGQFEQI
ncbi:MAG TPA: DUF4255 domain-containing protein [Cyclobacteriaceae bacterium]|nr:DUF4255 domain-containing protein [Cyclobacteriaceae bacterium]